MKVLLFTHKSDIDGLGNVVLAKIAFDEIEYVLCETFNLESEFLKYHENGDIYNFDKVFVTDLWLVEPTLMKVANDGRLKDKFFVFDHHKSVSESDCNKYSFTTLRIFDDNGLCSGTSLFYEYLVMNNFIDGKNQMIKDFSELTRKYDTWEWKSKYNDEMPHKLSLLFDCLGCDGYIELMFGKLNKKDNSRFVFDTIEEILISNKINQVQEKLANYARKVYYTDVSGLRAGIIFIDYEYRNDLAEYFRQNNYDIDFLMLIALDYGTISYRSIRDDVNVRLVAEMMGGKGHDKAASSPITEEQKSSLIDILTRRNEGWI